MKDRGSKIEISYMGTRGKDFTKPHSVIIFFRTKLPSNNLPQPFPYLFLNLLKFILNVRKSSPKF
jgi:hypothetical protein